MKHFVVACLALVLYHTSSVAQETSYTESFAGRIQGGLNMAFYTADFSSTGDILDCGQFSTGSGLNAVLQGIIEFPVTNNLGIGIGIGWAGRSGLMSRNNTYPTRDTTSGIESPLTSELTLDATMTYLEIQPDVRWALIGAYHERTLGLILGPRISLPLTTEFTQQEAVVSPEGATFIVDGQRSQTRHVASGKLTTRSQALVGASVGLESLIPIGEKIHLTPSLSFDYIFTNLLTDAPWNTYGIRAEVGIRFSGGRTDTVFVETVPVEPVVIAPIQIAMQFPRFSGEVVTGDHLVATLPIIPAVFFDSAQVNVPANYRRSLDASLTSTDPLEAHAWVLPRIARILEKNSGASVELVGAASITEDDRKGLGERRAESVKDALVRMGVAAGRIETRGAETPRVQSNPEFARGREENRRVDIVLKDAVLQEWVTAEQFAEVRSTIMVSAVRMGGDPASQKNLSLTIKVRGIDTTVSGIVAEIDLPVVRSVGTTQDTMHIGVDVSSMGALTHRDTIVNLNTLPRRQIDLQTEDFVAVLRFDYNSSKLTEDVKQLLEQLANKLPEGSIITVLGGADVLGSQERNEVLSEERATNTKNFIRSATSKKFTIEAGTAKEQYSDDTPQGRFLNRSIRVTARPK